MQGVGWLCGTHCWACLSVDCHEFRMPMQLHTLCSIHTASSFPPLVLCVATLTVFAQRGTVRQDRTWPSWASNNVPLKDLSNTRMLKHLATLATNYWAASHSFVEPGHSCFCSKFEKIVSVSEFLAGRMQWGRAWKQSGLRQTLNETVSKVDNLVWLPRARKNQNWSRGPTVEEFCAGTRSASMRWRICGSPLFSPCLVQDS